MKPHILSTFICIACLAFVNKSFGQFTLSADASNDTLRNTSSISYTFGNTVTNTHVDSIYIIWNVDLANTSIPSGWIVSACDNYTCPAWSGNSHNSAKIGPGSTGTWTVDIDPSGGGMGTGWVTEKLADNNAQTNKTSVYILTKSSTGITTVIHSNEDVTLYPNPARNEVNVIFDESMGIRSVAICNLIGKPVSLFKTAGNSAKLNIENLASGIYFIRLMDANSNPITTRKFTKL